MCVFERDRWRGREKKKGRGKVSMEIWLFEYYKLSIIASISKRVFNKYHPLHLYVNMQYLSSYKRPVKWKILLSSHATEAQLKQKQRNKTKLVYIHKINQGAKVQPMSDNGSRPL